MTLLALLLSLLAPLHAADAPKKAAPATRAALDALVSKLQSSPGDDALRRDIIALGRLKPAPALPEEAKRRLARGAAAVKGAKDASDWSLAVEEFKAASLAAPWSGDIYYNLGVAQDKAGDYDGSVRSLALAELAAPGSEDAKNLRYEVEYRRDREKAPKDAQKALEGAVFDDGNFSSILVSRGQLVFRERRSVPRGCLCGYEDRCGGPVGEELECRVMTLNGLKAEASRPDGSSGYKVASRYEISPDGETLVQKQYWFTDWDDLSKVWGTQTYKRRR
jgi:tetratricopeptide (TPR) repeat protein